MNKEEQKTIITNCVNCDECIYRSEDSLCDISKNDEDCPLYNYILKNSELTDNDLKYILDDYNINDIYNLVHNGDYIIYNISNMDSFGQQIYDLYYGELPNVIYRYFDFDAFGKDYLLNEEYVELENDRVIILHF